MNEEFYEVCIIGFGKVQNKTDYPEAFPLPMMSRGLSERYVAEDMLAILQFDRRRVRAYERKESWLREGPPVPAAIDWRAPGL